MEANVDSCEGQAKDHHADSDQVEFEQTEVYVMAQRVESVIDAAKAHADQDGEVCGQLDVKGLVLLKGLVWTRVGQE